ncbi:uncharacterized protein LOC133799928 [Humulus lupulus]|uniref:uncharacterized protein LOC133799928 n=1 Tax=Humulus lupulus TaxID=3486 RepID=UPI002B411C19|nr:uncharacterized protein LOC133799928 [Humulus lupulus]
MTSSSTEDPHASASTSTVASTSQAAAVIPANLAPLNLRLNRTSYSFWRSQMLPSLRAHQLEGFLTGDRPPPAATITDPPLACRSILNPAFQEWMRLDQFLISWLFNSISEEMMGHIFSTKSKARVLQLRTTLQSTRKGSTHVDEYILKMHCLGDSLIADGQQISEDELILYILGGLDSEYEAVIINLTSCDSITLSEVQFLL